MGLKWKGLFAVAGAAMAHLTLGTIYTFGNMAPYIASYMRMHSKSASMVTTADMTWIVAATLSCQGLLMSLGGILERALGSQLTVMLGCAIMSSGVCLTYFSIKHSFAMVVLTYGAMNGIGLSIAYISLISTGMQWFPKNRGVVNGFILGGFGLGAFIFNQIQTTFLNPENSAPDSNGYFSDANILERVPKVFALLGGMYAILQLIGCVFVTRPLHIDHQEIKPLIMKTCGKSVVVGPVEAIEQEDEGNLADTGVTRENFTPWQMIKTKEFHLLYWTMFCMAQTVNFLSAMYKAYGQTFIADDHLLAMIGAVSAIFNAGGRIVWGLIIDRYSFKTSMRCLCVLVILLLLTMPLTTWGGAYMFGVWICGIHFTMSGVFVLVPTCVANQFGAQNVGINYGIIFSNVALAGPVTAFISQTLTKEVGYTGMFYILAAFTAIGFALTLPFREGKRR